jgi:hypothetical protein
MTRPAPEINDTLPDPEPVKDMAFSLLKMMDG